MEGRCSETGKQSRDEPGSQHPGRELWKHPGRSRGGWMCQGRGGLAEEGLMKGPWTEVRGASCRSRPGKAGSIARAREEGPLGRATVWRVPAPATWRESHDSCPEVFLLPTSDLLLVPPTD